MDVNPSLMAGEQRAKHPASTGSTRSPGAATDDVTQMSGKQKLSYKFQRLRERRREAIGSGELSGKLPGERVLSRRFRVNAKTLSKALTDLAAEGLLERSIGRGTYVRGSSPAASSSTGLDKWLLVCDADQAHNPVVRHILQA